MPAGVDLSGDAVQFNATNEAQAAAFDAALTLALANRADMGYPWIDLDAKTLQLSVVDDRGRRAALQAAATLPIAGLAIRVTTAQASIEQLDQIADDVTRLADGGLPTPTSSG